jgi:hypothetical protein
MLRLVLTILCLIPLEASHHNDAIKDTYKNMGVSRSVRRPCSYIGPSPPAALPPLLEGTQPKESDEGRVFRIRFRCQVRMECQERPNDR